MTSFDGDLTYSERVLVKMSVIKAENFCFRRQVEVLQKTMTFSLPVEPETLNFHLIVGESWKILSNYQETSQKGLLKSYKIKNIC